MLLTYPDPIFAIALDGHDQQAPGHGVVAAHLQRALQRHFKMFAATTETCLTCYRFRAVSPVADSVTITIHNLSDRILTPFALDL